MRARERELCCRYSSHFERRIEDLPRSFYLCVRISNDDTKAIVIAIQYIFTVATDKTTIIDVEISFMESIE
jgi:hypothetical protein